MPDRIDAHFIVRNTMHANTTGFQIATSPNYFGTVVTPPAGGFTADAWANFVY